MGIHMYIQNDFSMMKKPRIDLSFILMVTSVTIKFKRVLINVQSLLSRDNTPEFIKNVCLIQKMTIEVNVKTKSPKLDIIISEYIHKME